MSKTENKSKKEDIKKDISYSVHEFGMHHDKIWKIATLTFPDSNDRGFEFEASNLRFVLRARKEDYYSLVEILFSEVLDEFQESDNYNPLIDDFNDFLKAKICVWLKMSKVIGENIGLTYVRPT